MFTFRARLIVRLFSLFPVGRWRLQSLYRAQGERREAIEGIALQQSTDGLERDGVEGFQLFIYGAILAQISPSHADGLHAAHGALAAPNDARADLAFRLTQLVG